MGENPLVDWPAGGVNMFIEQKKRRCFCVVRETFVTTFFCTEIFFTVSLLFCSSGSMLKRNIDLDLVERFNELNELKVKMK